MRILLKKGATEFGPETILVLSARHPGSGAFETLAGDPCAEDAIVNWASDRAVARVIAEAAADRRGPGHSCPNRRISACISAHIRQEFGQCREPRELAFPCKSAV